MKSESRNGAALALEGVLDEIEDYLERHQDVRDGEDGQPRPNEAMSLLSDLRWWRESGLRAIASETAEQEGYPGIAHDFETMRTALQQLLTRYTELVNSGDCGNWDPETELEIQDARAALHRANPTETEGKV